MAPPVRSWPLLTGFLGLAMLAGIVFAGPGSARRPAAPVPVGLNVLDVSSAPDLNPDASPDRLAAEGAGEPTLTASVTDTATETPTGEPAETATSAPTVTETAGATETPTEIPTGTDVPTITATATSTPTDISIPTDTQTATDTATAIPTSAVTETTVPTGTPTATATATVAAATSTPLPGGSNITLPARGMFYYPWFAESWTQQGIFPWTRYEPTLGYYDGGDAAVVGSHVADMIYAGVDVAIASWWGTDHWTDDHVPVLLSEAQGTSLKVAFYYEDEGFGNPSQATLTSDLEYINTQYGGSSAFAKINGRLVIYVYNADDRTCDVLARWKAANTINAYLVMKVFPGFAGCANQPDAWHQYGPSTRAHNFSPDSYNISPGFWRIDEAQPRSTRDPVIFAQNVRAMIASGADWQLVTSFNEWGEGTGVEDTVELGRVYLDILATDGQGGIPGTSTPTPQPSVTQTPGPSATSTATPAPTATLTPTSGPVATSTNSPTPTATTTPSSTATTTPLPTATRTNTPVPTRTSTSTPIATFTATPVPHTSTAAPTTGPVIFTPVADARVEQALPTTSFGSAVALISDTSPRNETYLRFTVTGLSGPVQSATLRLWVLDATSNGPPVSSCASTTWSETGITWANKPATNGPRDDKGTLARGVWVEYNVTSFVAGNGGVCFALVPQSSDGLDLSSKEGNNPPQLVIVSALASATATRTPPGLSTSTPTGVPVNSATPTSTIATGNIVFTAAADSRVDEARPTTNYGTDLQLRVDAGTGADTESFIRFSVSGVAGTVTRATVRVYVTSGSVDGPDVHLTGSQWTETGITWSNRPARVGSVLDDAGAVPTGSWIELDVTGVVTGNGVYSFVLATGSTDGTNLASRQDPANKPQLVISFG